MTKNTVVFYHANCTDGFGAALAAWTRLGELAEYVPVKYDQVKTLNDVDLLGDINGKNVIILDFSFPREVMQYIMVNALHTTWLDHHKTAFEMWCPDEPFHDEVRYREFDERHHFHLDNTRSGAMIAWRHWGLEMSKKAPLIIQHIDDYDRWQFKLKHTKNLSRYLRTLPYDFKAWAPMLDWTSNHTAYKTAKRIGEQLLAEHDRRVASAAKHVRNVRIWTDRESVEVGLATNAPADMASDLGHVLAKQSGSYGLVYQIGADLNVKCSLRSVGDYDVSKLAKIFGGGGHKNAAGCEMTLRTFNGLVGGEPWPVQP